MKISVQSEKNNMLLNIEKLRREMIKLGSEKGLSSEETILASKKLDSALNEFVKVKGTASNKGKSLFSTSPIFYLAQYQ